jgi:hypothetical protein
MAALLRTYLSTCVENALDLDLCELPLGENAPRQHQLVLGRRRRHRRQTRRLIDCTRGEGTERRRKVREEASNPADTSQQK